MARLPYPVVLGIFVVLSSVLGTLGSGPFGLLFLPWLWTTSVLADIVFVAGSVGAFLAAYSVTRRWGMLGAYAGGLLTLLVYFLAFAVIIVPTPAAPAGVSIPGFGAVIMAGWPGIVLGGIAPWWAARQGWLEPDALPKAREVVLDEA
jgi:hypothetical protein